MKKSYYHLYWGITGVEKQLIFSHEWSPGIVPFRQKGVTLIWSCLMIQQNTIKLYQVYLRNQADGKITHHSEFCSSSERSKRGLVLATSWSRFHALPTWFQSTAFEKFAWVSRLFKINMSSAKWTNGEGFLFDMAVDSKRKEEFLVLDGGVATELTRAGFNLDVSQSHNI